MKNMPKYCALFYFWGGGEGVSPTKNIGDDTHLGVSQGDQREISPWFLLVLCRGVSLAMN